MSPTTRFFLKKIIKKEQGLFSQIIKYLSKDELLNLEIYQLLCSFPKQDKQTADKFILYASSQDVNEFMYCCFLKYKKPK